MTAVLALIGTSHAAIGTDSLRLELTATGLVTVSSAQKTFQVPGRIAAFAGVESVNGSPLGPLLAQALATANTVADVLPRFVALAEPLLVAALPRWVELTGGAEGFLQAVVAGKRTPNSEVAAWECLPVLTDDGHAINFQAQQLGPTGPDAFGALYGARHPLLGPVTSAYAAEHQVRSLLRDEPFGAAPVRHAADATAAELESAVRTTLEAAVATPGWEGGLWLPNGQAPVARPVQTVSL